MLGETIGAPHTIISKLAPDAQGNWALGERLTKTCMDTYTQSRTGLGAEIVFYYVNADQKQKAGDNTDRAWYVNKRKP